MQLYIKRGRNVEKCDIDEKIIKERLDDPQPIVLGKNFKNSFKLEEMLKKGYQYVIDPLATVSVFEKHTGTKYEGKQTPIPRIYLTFVCIAYNRPTIKEVLSEDLLVVSQRKRNNRKTNLKFKEKLASKHGFESWSDWVEFSEGDVPEEEERVNFIKSEEELEDLF